ncbi:MAG: PolC-type DNA polymerase III [Ilumatobacter sp.]|uniref:3'-5' exonuclease n=1 Tax=Ilumatobacter sp. TaxID=1967498 RepID=UPI0039187CF4
MALPRFAVVDLETSGLSTSRHRVLQIGVVTVDADGTVVDEWESLVRLRWPLARVGPTHVHGLTRSDLRGAPRIGSVLDEFERQVGESLFTAHNAGFDGSFLMQAARRRNGCTPPCLSPRLCTLRMSRRLDPERTLSHRLGDVCARYGVAIERPHDALADASATAAILPHLLAAHSITEFEQLTPFFDREPAAETRGPIPQSR